MKFYLVWAAMFVALSIFCFFGLAAYLQSYFAIPYGEAIEFIWRLLIYTIAWWKQLFVLALLLSLSYLSARYTLTGKL